MSDKIFIANQKNIFTVREAAEYLTVCPKTIYSLIVCGDIEAIKIGSRYKITAEALSRYIDSKKNYSIT